MEFCTEKAGFCTEKAGVAGGELVIQVSDPTSTTWRSLNLSKGHQFNTPQQGERDLSGK